MSAICVIVLLYCDANDCTLECNAVWTVDRPIAVGIDTTGAGAGHGHRGHNERAAMGTGAAARTR